MHTSATATMSGNASLSALKAVQTGPLGSQALVPSASFRSGMPNRIAERTPAFQAPRASSTRLSTESWATPGIDAIGLRTPFPATAKSGSMKSLGSRRVSRTSDRSVSVRLRRRSRSGGKAIESAPERRVPAREIVADVHRGARREVHGELHPPAELARVGERAQVLLRAVGERREPALEERGEGDQRREAELELHVRGHAEDADGRRPAGSASPLPAREQAGARGD